MDNNDVGDATLRKALEAALRDLALTLDGIENQDKLATLLAMLQTRLKGLLKEHGLTIEWQVNDDLQLPNTGPSESL